MRDLYIGGYLLYFYKDHSRHIGVERLINSINYFYGLLKVRGGELDITFLIE